MMQEYAAYWDRLVEYRGAVKAVTGWDSETYLSFYRRLFSHVIADFKVVADVGCGPALMYPLIKEMWPGAAYYGYDISGQMVDYARQNAPEGVFTLIDGPLNITPKADLVLCHSVFTHIFPEDALRYLGIFKRSMNDHGAISASIHTECTDKWVGDIRRIDYSPDYFEHIVDTAGLKVAGYQDVQVPAGRARYYLLATEWEIV